MRALYLLLPFALLACGQAETNHLASVPEEDRIECRIGGADQFERFCAIERTQAEGGTILTIRKPDGGFRRLQLTGDGRGVVAADGAEKATVSLFGDRQIDVAIGGDTFRLPATIRPRS